MTRRTRAATVLAAISLLAACLCGCRDAEFSDLTSRGTPTSPLKSRGEERGEPRLSRGADIPVSLDAQRRDDDRGLAARQAEISAPQTEDDSEAALFRRLDETFKRKGEVKDGVYRLVTPRSDLLVTMDGRDVATGAFLESDFRFWRCPCGKLLVNGQFVLADYEVNDVVDELQEGRLDVVSIGPLLLHEKPRLLMVRFQGEGTATEIATALRSALSYTGEERSKPLPADLSPSQQ